MRDPSGRSRQLRREYKSSSLHWQRHTYSFDLLTDNLPPTDMQVQNSRQSVTDARSWSVSGCESKDRGNWHESSWRMQLEIGSTRLTKGTTHLISMWILRIGFKATTISVHHLTSRHVFFANMQICFGHLWRFLRLKLCFNFCMSICIDQIYMAQESMGIKRKLLYSISAPSRGCGLPHHESSGCLSGATVKYKNAQMKCENFTADYSSWER